MTKDDLRLDELKYLKIPLPATEFKEQFPDATLESTMPTWFLLMQCAVLSIVGKDFDDIGRTEVLCLCELIDPPDGQSKDTKLMYVMDILLGTIKVHGARLEDAEVSFTPSVTHLRMEQ